ncbi:hypothetical protein O3P69_014389 [Scylla paramamosain]|uniref:Ammonium transporter AmtB-like domain-containing protein n=1 Tax=Scylla paramamosain TaxID=85552 RepID=A0AAW0TAZ0_SCYPA
MHCLKSSSPSPSAKIQQNSLGGEFHLMIARPFTSARDTSLLQVSNEATDTDSDFSPNTSKIPRLKVVQSTPKSASYSHDCECSTHGNRAETQRQNETPQENDKNAGRPLWYLTRHTAAILLLQGIFLLLFIIFVRYGEAADASHGLNNHYPIMGGSVPGDNPSLHLHHNVLGTVVMLVGLGMRVTGAPGHLLSGVGWTLLLAGLALQWAVLCRGFLDGDDNPVDLDVTRVLEAELVSIGTCIAQGAVVGVASPLQMLVLMMVHVPLHLLNHHLAFTVFKSVDLGGCVSIHVFGSVFGMATSRALSRHSPDTSPKPSSASQVTALVAPGGFSAVVLGSLIPLLSTCAAFKPWLLFIVSWLLLPKSRDKFLQLACYILWRTSSPLGS